VGWLALARNMTMSTVLTYFSDLVLIGSSVWSVPGEPIGYALTVLETACAAMFSGLAGKKHEGPCQLGPTRCVRVGLVELAVAQSDIGGAHVMVGLRFLQLPLPRRLKIAILVRHIAVIF
jgi:hypothetical protein